MDPRVIVGANLLRARKQAGLTQAELGERVGSLLAQPNGGAAPWSRQTVSAAEKGDRRFDATELMVFARVTGKSPSWFLTPADPTSVIDLPSGEQVSWEVIEGTRLDRESLTQEERALDLLFDHIEQAETRARETSEALVNLRDLAGYFYGIELALRSEANSEDFDRGVELLVAALDRMEERGVTLASFEHPAEDAGNDVGRRSPADEGGTTSGKHGARKSSAKRRKEDSGGVGA